MTTATWFHFLLVLFLATTVTTTTAQERLTSEAFKAKIDAGEIDALIDVRTQAEWDQGHIENAMLVESLVSFGTDAEITTPEDLAGCEFCTLGIYCRSGNRAGTAITKLQESGFKGRLYNGLGVRQWTEANFTLVTGDSVDAPCVVDDAAGAQCRSEFMSGTTWKKTILSFICMILPFFFFC